MKNCDDEAIKTNQKKKKGVLIDDWRGGVWPAAAV